MRREKFNVELCETWGAVVYMKRVILTFFIAL